jgi:sugar O-acyltransferase (sialic acid O-acetyltransferase NeuD family)
MSKPKKLIIIGGGGAGVEALWIARRMNQAAGSQLWEMTGIADDNPARAGEVLDGIPVIGTTAQAMTKLLGSEVYFLCVIGNNRQRQRLADAWEAAGFLAATLIDPSVIIADTAVVRPGSYVGPMAIIAPHAVVGRHALINVGASIGHHAECSDYSQVCPGARLSGYSRLGTGAFVGSNGVMAPGIELGSWATLGATSFALKNVRPGVTAVGNPARACF